MPVAAKIALPDAELDGFVDALARRIASFDRHALAAAKNLVNQVSLPSADRGIDALNSFQTALTWPEAQQRIQALLKRGPQQEGDFESRWPALLGTLLETWVWRCAASRSWQISFANRHKIRSSTGLISAFLKDRMMYVARPQ